MKESVQKFDLEAAFKALNEVEIPVVKGIRPNRENLQEKFTKKLVSEVLVEDYFDVSDSAELEQASEEREAEIAKAKLARIEKIVDLDAETEEDLLPSYVGKFIIQCPQCMTLFYKKEEDIEKSDENPDVVNLNEPCQHCGNSSGYTLIGKVDQVGEDEAAQYDVEDFEEDELNLDFDEEPTEEVEEPVEETEEVATEEEELDLEPIEETEEEEIKESLTESAVKQRVFVDYTGSNSAFKDTYAKQLEKDGVEDFEAVDDAEMKALVAAVAAGDNVVLYTVDNDYKYNCPEIVDKANFKVVMVSRDLKEDVDLNKQLDLYNDFIKYLQKMVEQDEDALEEAKKLGNKEVIAAIEKRLENSKAELKAALPTTVKDEVTADELPTPEEVDMGNAAENSPEEKEEKADAKKESLTEAAITWKKVDDLFAVMINGKQVYVGTEQECKNFANAHSKNAVAQYQKVEVVKGAEVPVATKKESLTDGLRTWVCVFDGNEVGTVEAGSEEEAYEKMEATWPELHYGEYDGVAEVFPEDLDLEEATTTVSTLKRKYSATELIVKELVQHPLFKGLSTRTIQRVLLPYYIEYMGRENLSTQAMIDFFEEEGFAIYVLDHLDSLDEASGKELLKADGKFIQALDAYAVKYNLVPEERDLEDGETKFDYLYEITLKDLDAEARRETINELIDIYNTILNPKTEALKEGAVEGDLNTLLDSDEFKKPITEKEVETIKAKYEGLEEEVAPGIESEIAMRHIVDTWESVEDFDDETFNKLTENYLTEVYSNVKSFKATGCDLKDGKLVVEGNITFNSGKVKPTTFVYEAKEAADKKVVLEGLNADFATEKAFVLNCKIDTANCLVVESLGYKYSINETLVEGLLK